MKSAAKSTLLLAVILALALWVINSRESVALPAWFSSALFHAKQFQEARPVLAIFLFCLAHFLSSMFSVPGSCTLLNVSSGAIFGFSKGCLIVYPITLLSACVGYFAATKLRALPFMIRYQTLLSSLRTRLHSGGFLFLVTLRLSPFIPYGVLNPLLGLLHVPFGTFITSTFVGIFLDVFLLNSIGATLAAASGSNAEDGKKMLLIFCGLLAAMATFHFVTAKIKAVRPK